MTKLLFITNSTNGAGGLERVLSLKLNYIANILQYDIHVLVLNKGDENPFYNFSENITFHSVSAYGNPLKYFYKYKIGIQDIIKKTNPDIISVCDDGLKGLLFPVIINNTKPVIYERHASFDIFRKNDSLIQNIILSTKKWISRFGAKKFDKFIVLTNENLLEWNLPNMEVIPNPLSFYPETTSSLDNKIVMSVGSHNHNKGFDRLLYSWKIISEKHKDWKLEIYGKQNPDYNLQSLVNKLSLSNSVKLFNPVKNIQNKYIESSIYALPSRSEGFGMVLTEAMSCGVPCVAFDCPSGPKDIIANNEDGFLINNNDIESFANAILTLIEDVELRKRMGKQARESVKRYKIENIILHWDRLFKELINTK